MRRSFFMFDSRYGFTIAAMLVVMGLCAESHAGIYRQGKHLQGKHLQGKHLQGKHLQGKHLQGKHLQGRALAGLRGRDAGFSGRSSRLQEIRVDAETAEATFVNVHGRPRHAR